MESLLFYIIVLVFLLPLLIGFVAIIVMSVRSDSKGETGKWNEHD
jgi:hypothetical protein